MRYEERGICEPTQRIYRARWDEFCEYCRDRGIPEFPAAPEPILNFLVRCAKDGLCYNALRMRQAAIRRAHVLAGFADPTNDPRIRDFLQKVRRTCGYSRLYPPLEPQQVRVLVEAIARRATMPPEKLRALRDTALVLLCFLGPLRRKQIRMIRCENLIFTSVGVAIGGIRKDGRALPIRYSRTARCPVAALEAWLQAGHIAHGPVFRGVLSDGRLIDDPLSYVQIARIMRQHLVRAGLEPVYGTSILHRGFIAEALAQDVPATRILRQTELSARTPLRPGIKWRIAPDFRVNG